jgi:peptide/nickel transport system ATP-binding protein
LLGIIANDAGGTVALNGTTLGTTLQDRSAAEVGAIQIVFQNPDSALNRRHSVTRIVSRAVQKLTGVSKDVSDDRAQSLLNDMSVDPLLHSVKPTQLSGGLKQRVAIARSFAGKPQLIVCDEPTSALDVSVQANILNLLVDLQVRENVSYVFISHDLGVVRYISDRIAVLYLGRIMELGSAETVFAGPHHPYTEALVSSVPDFEGAQRVRIRLGGEVPSPANPPSGCVLNPRCPRMAGSGVEHLCTSVEPSLTEVEPGHFMRCHIPLAQLGSLDLTHLQPALRVDVRDRAGARGEQLLADPNATEVAADSGFRLLMAMAPFEGIDIGLDRRSPVSWSGFERHGAFPFAGALESVSYQPGEPAPDSPADFVDFLKEWGQRFE